MLLIHLLDLLTELYDGTGWTSAPPMATGRGRLAGAGTQTAGLAFGGVLQEQQQHRRMDWCTYNSDRFNLDYLIIKYI
jgi:hypothetical protein